jgi:hypothetical protein
VNDDVGRPPVVDDDYLLMAGDGFPSAAGDPDFLCPDRCHDTSVYRSVRNSSEAYGWQPSHTGRSACWLCRELDAARPPVTLADLAENEQDETWPKVSSRPSDEVAELNRKLLSYRATLDAGADPAVVSQWITETRARKQ